MVYFFARKQVWGRCVGKYVEGIDDAVSVALNRCVEGV